MRFALAFCSRNCYAKITSTTRWGLSSFLVMIVVKGGPIRAPDEWHPLI